MTVDTTREVEELETVTVDADFHLTEQVSDFMPYLEEPWDKMLTGDDPFDENAEFYDPFPDAGMVSPHIATGRSQVFHPDAVRTVQDIEEGLELLGVDRALVTPGATVLKLGIVHNDDIAAAIAHAFNEFMLDRIRDESDDIHVPITIAPQNPSDAAAEIDDRADESRISCVLMPNGGVNPPLGHEWYDPIWEATERAGLPFVMHGGAGANLMKSFPVQYDWFSTTLEDHTLGHPLQHIVNLVSMIVNGVPEKYPSIDFVFQEAGIGWVPYFAHRMDNEYHQKRQEASTLSKPPSAYALEDFYYTSQPLEGHEGAVDYVCQMSRLMNAPDTLMWSSDYPHHDFEHTDDIMRVFAREYNRRDLERIFGGNANEVFF